MAKRIQCRRTRRHQATARATHQADNGPLPRSRRDPAPTAALIRRIDEALRS